ncbi:Mpv17/PMP22 family protein [Sporobolomyces salmoneus]|uniref:Mpv17/PMP22 family protein n=1 Tax=Sporobolomyces salmoneus TaxID=183962 RepID=UPI00316F3F5D
MAFIFQGYIRLLQNHTLPTQIATGGITSGIGDLTYQLGIQQKEFNQVEWYKTRRLMYYGAFCFAPISNRWHWCLNRITIKNSKWSTIAARTLTDMLIFSPFATCYFYLCGGLFEGRPWSIPPSQRSTAGPGVSVGVEQQGIKERIEERLWGTVKLQWAVFGPSAVFMHAVVPVYARPPFMNAISIGWSAFLASAAHRGEHQPAPTTTTTTTATTGTPIEVAAAEVMQ